MYFFQEQQSIFQSDSCETFFFFLRMYFMSFNLKIQALKTGRAKEAFVSEGLRTPISVIIYQSDQHLKFPQEVFSIWRRLNHDWQKNLRGSKRVLKWWSCEIAKKDVRFDWCEQLVLWELSMKRLVNVPFWTSIYRWRCNISITPSHLQVLTHVLKGLLGAEKTKLSWDWVKRTI